VQRLRRALVHPAPYGAFVVYAGQRGGTRYFPGGGKRKAAKKPTDKRKAKKGAKRKTAVA